MTPFKKVISFGKIAYTGNAKTNEVTLEIEIRNKTEVIEYENLTQMFDVPEISVCGNVWNSKHTDIEMGGQCLDSLIELLPNNKRLRRITEIWKQYHLNGLKSDTKTQTEAIEAWKAQGNKYDYTAACEYLKSIGLYTDRGYKYGHGWLYMPVPAEIIEELKALAA